MNDADYGRALRICRAIRGWKQEDVAEKTGLSASYVSLIESGHRVPSATAVRKLTRAMEVPEPLFTLLAKDSKKVSLHLGRSLLMFLRIAGLGEKER